MPVPADPQNKITGQGTFRSMSRKSTMAQKQIRKQKTSGFCASGDLCASVIALFLIVAAMICLIILSLLNYTAP